MNFQRNTIKKKRRREEKQQQLGLTSLPQHQVHVVDIFSTNKTLNKC